MSFKLAGKKNNVLDILPQHQKNTHPGLHLHDTLHFIVVSSDPRKIFKQAYVLYDFINDAFKLLLFVLDFFNYLKVFFSPTTARKFLSQNKQKSDCYIITGLQKLQF